MAYVDEGPRDGPPILLVHGIPTSSWLYRKIIPLLTERDFRVIAPDLLGYGASDKPADLRAYAMDRQAGRILQLMQGLGVEKWTHVCHDLGGPWTWEIADREPQHFERLVILNTTAYRDGWRPPWEMRVMGSPLGPALMGLIRQRTIGPMVLGMLFRPFVAHPERIDASVVEGYWLPVSEGLTHAVRQFTTTFDFTFAQLERYGAALRRLNVPTMLIWGKRDPVLDYVKMPGQFARDLRIPPERIHILDDASHFLQEDQPETIARLAGEFAAAPG